MTTFGLDVLQSCVKGLHSIRAIGRVDAIDGGTVRVTGLSSIAAAGDLVRFRTDGGESLLGEVVGLASDHITVLQDGAADGLQIGAETDLLGQQGIAPHHSWLGRVVDPYGEALDGCAILRGERTISVRGSPMNPTERRSFGQRLDTGMKVFNTMLPLVRGQRIGLFAGSGIGKSTLLARFALGVDCDVVVIALVGERGREVSDFIDRVLGPEGMRRAVVVAATSDTSPMARRRCAWSAMSVAEYFRDHGHQVLLLMDSVTRFADAHREIAIAAGEDATLRGYPASTTQLITALCERSGPGVGHLGDITAVFSVLVAGSDMEEPIADILRGVLDGHVVLDRTIAERGRFPAIDVLRSVSRSLPDAASEAENNIIAQARRLLGAYERSELMVQSGLYSYGSDPDTDAAISCFPALDAFFAMRESGGIESSFQSLKKCF